MESINVKFAHYDLCIKLQNVINITWVKWEMLELIGKLIQSCDSCEIF